MGGVWGAGWDASRQTTGKQVELTDGTYAFLIASDLEDNDLDNEPHRFRLAVHVADTTAGYFDQVPAAASRL